MTMSSGFDFGYEWYWTSGHLVPAAVFGILLFLAWRLGWQRKIAIGLAVGLLWALTGFWIVGAKFNLNGPDRMPTENFLPTETGLVLDLGAGSGRTTLMVLQARPGVRVVSLDKFASGYGIEANTPERLRSNLAAAGVGGRVEVVVADMREIPFGEATFDAVVSGYAMDHLGREDFLKAAAESRRVLRPGGQLLFMTINRDVWVRIAFPFLHGHGYFGREPAAVRWRGLLTSSGLEIVEEGTQSATIYMLCRRR